MYPPRLALHWTLGTEPVAVAPIKDDWHQKLVLDPDGKWLLVAPTLSVASIAECHEDQECPAEPPVTGPALQLYDLATHKQLWSISETTPSWGGPAQPVVGPGGKYAVMPVDAVKGRVCLVVDMKHGEVVQRIKCEGPSETIRFSQDGKSFTIFGNSRIKRFEFNPQ